VAQRLNTGGFYKEQMAWSPDGRWLAFSSDRDGDVLNIYRVPSDGSGEPERLVPSDGSQAISSWSSGGVIAYLEDGDIWMLPPNGRPSRFFTSDAIETDAWFSPDGHWLAYVSNANGRPDVYVRPYPGPEPATLISGDGGTNPAWSPNGRQIYYRQSSGTGVLMAVEITLGSTLEAGRPYPIIDPWPAASAPVRPYDVFAEGSFVTYVPEWAGLDDQSRAVAQLRRYDATELHVVLNWFEELKRRVPVR
jgi:dipeptidyl aminopeptidase/acylaminoacyl peptidase